MVPTSLAHLYSGARNTPYSMSGADAGHPARMAMGQLPWELHPKKFLKQLEPSSASVGVTGITIYDVTGAIRMDSIGQSQSGSHKKGIYYTPGTSASMAWTEGAGSSPGNATFRVMDVNNDNNGSELIGAMLEARMHALTLGDIAQAQLLDEIAGLFLSAINGIKPGCRAYPAFRMMPEDAGVHRLKV